MNKKTARTSGPAWPGTGSLSENKKPVRIRKRTDCVTGLFYTGCNGSVMDAKWRVNKTPLLYLTESVPASLTGPQQSLHSAATVTRPYSQISYFPQQIQLTYNNSLFIYLLTKFYHRSNDMSTSYNRHGKRKMRTALLLVSIRQSINLILDGKILAFQPLFGDIPA